jgi:purine catabolism regulator
MLTLGDLVGDLDVRLVAGASGLERAVRWVHSSELLDPTPWLSGGELLLTTGLQLIEPAQQRDYVRRLADHGAAGVGFGVGFGHETVPEPLREAAEAMGMPVFEVPYHLPFIAVTERASTHIVNAHYTVLQRALAAHERLERLVLSERGLEAVTGALSELIGGKAAVFDARGDLMAGRQDVVGSENGSRELGERILGGARRGFAAGRGLALPVARTPPASGHAPAPQAWLVGARDDAPLTELDRLTLHQAVIVVALELLRRRVARDTERRLAGDVLTGLVSGQLAGVELARRLEPFGLSERVGALVFSLPSEGRDLAEDALSEAVEEFGGGLTAGVGGLVCVLMAVDDGDEASFATAERIRARFSSELDVAIPAGAGRAVEAGAARRSFHEARCALEARNLGANGSEAAPLLATFRDLGSFELLLSLQDDDALRLFCDSILAPIEQGEGAYGGELMRSLEAFIECNGQWERAARQLFCHRHTLRYRIRRVEELTGRSLDSARDRIEFWLALRGRELTN